VTFQESMVLFVKVEMTYRERAWAV